MRLSARSIVVSILLGAALPVQALSLNDLRPGDAEIAEWGCQKIDGTFPVSIQPAIFYDSPETYKGVLPALVSKAHLSVSCGGKKGTVFYMEYKDSKDSDRVGGFLTGLLYGGSGRSAAHPESTYRFERYNVIVSAPMEHILHKSIIRFVGGMDIPDTLVRTLMERKKCASGAVFGTPCGALSAFLEEPGAPTLDGKYLFGKSWELDAQGNVKKEFFETMKLTKGTGKEAYAAYWTPVSPDNDGEKRTLENLAAGGKDAVVPGELEGYLAGIEKNTKVDVRVSGKSLLFITKGNSACVRFVSKGVVLMVATEHWTGKPGGYILAYFRRPAG